MTYDLTTTIEGPVDCTVAQIVASVLDSPQSIIWPARTQYSDDDLIEYAKAAIHWTDTFGFRTAGQVGRANHETNHLRYTGDVPFGSHNFAGLGATGGVTGRGYDSIDAGVLAVCAHQACYTWGAVEHWPEHLRQYHNASGRYADVMANEGAGKVKTWGDFTNCRWARTKELPCGTLDNGYARASVAKANRVLAQPGGEPMPTPYDHIIPGMIDARSQLATATQGQGGVVRGPYERIPLSAKRGVVVHYRGVVTDVNAGLASFKSDATYHVGKNWARNGETPVLGSGIMYHIGIDGQGNVYLLRDLDRVLWHCGAWPQNENTLAIQLPLGGSQRATNKQLAALNRVVDGWLAFTKAPATEVWGHQELSPTDCPGTLMTDFVKPYRNAPPAKPATEEREFDVPGIGRFTVGGGFLRYWDAKGGLEVFGYPLSNETKEDGVTVQYFERAVFEHRPGQWPDRWDVTLRRLGAEALERKAA